MKQRFPRLSSRPIFWVLILMVPVIEIAAFGLNWQHRLSAQTVPPLSSKAQTAIYSSMATEEATQLAVRSFQVEIKGGLKSYNKLAADISDYGNRVEFILTILPNASADNRNPAVHEYKAALSPQAFNSFWQKLQSLNAGHLPSAAPPGNRPGNMPQLPGASSQRSSFVVDAPTYLFTIKDGKQGLNHQFGVYAPRYVEDKRYQEVTAAFYDLLKLVFGDRPFSDLRGR